MPLPEDREVRARIVGFEVDRVLAARVGCAPLPARMAPPEMMRAAAEAVAAASVPGCQGARVPGCQGARVPGCQGARVPGLVVIGG